MIQLLLSVSLLSAKRGISNFIMGCDRPANRTLNKYDGFTDHTPKLGGRSEFSTAEGFREGPTMEI